MDFSGLLNLFSTGSQALGAVGGFLNDRATERYDRKALIAQQAAAREEAAFMQQDAARAAQEEQRLASNTASDQKVAYLKSGVDLSGSPLLVMEETRAKGAENAGNIIQGANRRARALVNASAYGQVRYANPFESAFDLGKGLMTTNTAYQDLLKETTKTPKNVPIPGRKPTR